MTADEELVRRWQDGDDDAAEQLLRAHTPVVRRLFATKVDASMADELLQRTLMECAVSVHRLRDLGRFRTFLLVIARRQLYRHFAALRLAKKLEVDPRVQSLAELADDSGDAFVVAAEKRRLLRALRQIPLELQIALELYYWEGLQTLEIAEILEIPQGTIKSRLRRARAAVEERMREPRTGVSTSSRRSFTDWARSIRKRMGV